MADVTEFLERLKKARFTGELVLRLENGSVESARLVHLVPFSEFKTRELPAIDPEPEFELKP